MRCDVAQPRAESARCPISSHGGRIYCGEMPLSFPDWQSPSMLPPEWPLLGCYSSHQASRCISTVVLLHKPFWGQTSSSFTLAPSLSALISLLYVLPSANEYSVLVLFSFEKFYNSLSYFQCFTHALIYFSVWPPALQLANEISAFLPVILLGLYERVTQWEIRGQIKFTHLLSSGFPGKQTLRQNHAFRKIIGERSRAAIFNWCATGIFKTCNNWLVSGTGLFSLRLSNKQWQQPAQQ